jgi:hypothetical protein
MEKTGGGIASAYFVLAETSLRVNDRLAGA